MSDTTDRPTTDSVDGLESDLAATYAVLAVCWREPSDRLVAVANEGELTPVVGDLDGVDPDDLRVEYTRLFIGPAGPPCPPYESVYRDGEDDAEFGPVEGPSTVAVRRWYRAFGVHPAPEYSDLPDHIAAELEFAAALADEGRVDRLEQFLDEHLRVWADTFLDRVEAETCEGFYAALARTTREVLLE
ncbi:TorD/DmsD family molecular chaperone [Halohasta salina]|uniref:TorD/DmsD family molecular chaperone n=1 Tax=Halohasta salina TaxID=2961621 RepID=UPI0020A549BB|nr:molecular chaperone TorD family protein [Halohasta salina]